MSLAHMNTNKYYIAQKPSLNKASGPETSPYTARQIQRVDAVSHLAPVQLHMGRAYVWHAGTPLVAWTSQSKTTQDTAPA